jgi:Dyp-type peroxidase family
MKYTATSYLTASKHIELEKQMIAEKRRQAGIAFPAPRKQDYLLIIRLDVSPVNDKKLVSEGLERLCTLFEHIDNGKLEIEDTSSQDEMYMYPLNRFNFTGTIGFGKSFFRKLDLMKKCPKNLYDMPSHYELGDNSPYALPQTDMILQLASNNYSVNMMVLQNDYYLRYHKGYPAGDHSYLHDSENGPLDLMGSLNGWAKITDVHNGFHRADGRNLMGFYDGISNPHRLVNNNIWISEDEEGRELANGTYMVFLKIQHNLREWNKLDTQEQEKWVGRSKATGLLLGTLSIGEEKRLLSELHSTDSSKQKQAMVRLSQLIDEQRNPRKNFFDPYDIRYLNINKNCPISSHSRKSNPRQPNGRKEKFIFRRGCLYMEEKFTDYPKSGILFISFQNDIKIFEELKRNIDQRISTPMKTEQPTKIKNYFGKKIPARNSFYTLTLGGGYYFIPPIQNKRISYIGQQFF